MGFLITDHPIPTQATPEEFLRRNQCRVTVVTTTSPKFHHNNTTTKIMCHH